MQAPGVSRRILALAVLALAAASGLTAGCSSESSRKQAKPLRVVGAPMKRFAVSFYDAGGTYPQVQSPDRRFTRVNAALRRAIADDQRRYAAGVGDWLHDGWCGGIYVSAIDPRLMSASTVVVSAMLPALELSPCGNEGSGWVSTTVRVPSGRPVGLAELFAQPMQGLRALAKAWRLQFARQRVSRALLPGDFRAGAFKDAFFALTPNGLAVGFWQDGPTARLHATVPYDAVRPYLSTLGATLVGGVRRPIFDLKNPLAAFNRPPDALPERIHTFFKTTSKGTPECELAEGTPHLPTFVHCLAASTPTRAVSVDLTRGRMRVCRGIRCMSNAPENVRTLGDGEWIASNSFTCVSLRGGIRCLAKGQAGFLLSARGLQLCRNGYLLCPRRR